MGIDDFETDPDAAQAEAEYLEGLSERDISDRFQAPEEYDEDAGNAIIHDIILSHFKDFLWNDVAQKPYMVIQGSAGSGKTHSVCQRFCYLFLNCKNTQFAVIRASSPNLVRSVYLGTPSVVEQLAKWGVPISKWLNKTERKIVNPVNGNTLWFIGVDDPRKLQSMNVNYVWLEEATELDDDKFKQLLTRNRRMNPNPGRINQMFLTYNPISVYNWVIQRFIVKPTQNMIENSAIHYSNIKQNPYLDVNYIKIVYDIASRAREYFMTYILGVPGIPLGLIYPNIKFEDRDDWPEEVRDCRPYYGIDWGINDPTVLVECRDLKIQEDGFTRTRVYARLRYYETGKKSSDLIAFLNDKKISRSAPLYCDHNMKEGNMNLQQEGFNAIIAMKNIFAGISYIKGLEVIVDSHDPLHTHAEDELSGYTWEKDPEDSERFLDKPIDKNNHFCDAMRYAIFSHHLNSSQVTPMTLNINPTPYTQATQPKGDNLNPYANAPPQPQFKPYTF